MAAVKSLLLLHANNLQFAPANRLKGCGNDSPQLSQRERPGLMNAQDLLSVSAEISIAILGFAAIASVLRGGQEGVTPDGRFWGMLALAFLSFVASLAPLPFLLAEVNAAHIWGIGSSVLALSMSISAVLTLVAVKRANERAGVAANFVILAIFSTIMASTAMLAFYNSGVFNEATFPLYFGSIVSVHIITAAVFVRILVVWLRK